MAPAGRAPTPSAAATPLPRRPTSTSEYQVMIETGLLGSEDKVELIEGEILLRPPTGNDHTWGVTKLNVLLMGQQTRGFILQTQSTIHLAEGFSPDPDLTLLNHREDLYLRQPATASEVLLVIEIASSSLRYDLQVKAPLYARAGVPELWVVELSGRTVHRFTNPSEEGYREHYTHQDGETLSPAHIPMLNLPVREMVPPAAEE